MTTKVVLAGIIRTVTGKFRGSPVDIPTPRPSAFVVEQVLKGAGIKDPGVSEILTDYIIRANLDQDVVRQTAILAGPPQKVPMLTLSQVCGSGLQSVNVAASRIHIDEADVVIVSGMENTFAAPYTLQRAHFGYRVDSNKIVDTIVNGALWDALNNYHMGVTAENVAKKYGVTREMQDELAAWSRSKYKAAQGAGRFGAKITPLETPGKKGVVAVFSIDGQARVGVTVKGISDLKSASLKDGTIAAANTSGANDDAAAVIVMSAERTKELGIKPIIRWVDGSWIGMDPATMDIGPAFSTQKLLTKLNMDIDEMEVVETNEVFAAQALTIDMELKWNEEKVNPNGGAVTIDHPADAPGCYILCTLLYELQHRNGGKGLVAPCVGDGVDVSTIMEAL